MDYLKIALRPSANIITAFRDDECMLELRHRHRLRRKEIAKFAEDLQKALGVSTFSEDDAVDLAEGPRFNVILLGSFAYGFVVDNEAYLTVRGLLKWPPQKAFASVDEGAIKFLCNGADVMGPGISEVDTSIKAGDFVWVRDFKHKKPLVAGKALVDGSAMASKAPGKAIKNLHFVGDELWNVGCAIEKPKKDEEE
jgi:PUA-domain protein